MSRSDSSREVRLITSRPETSSGPARPVDERAAVRRDQVLFGRDAHAVTCDSIRPSSSSFATTSWADSSGSWSSVSIRSSGLAGSS